MPEKFEEVRKIYEKVRKELFKIVDCCRKKYLGNNLVCRIFF